jgi:hypothetical protein
MCFHVFSAISLLTSLLGFTLLIVFSEQRCRSELERDCEWNRGNTAGVCTKFRIFSENGGSVFSFSSPAPMFLYRARPGSLHSGRLSTDIYAQRRHRHAQRRRQRLVCRRTKHPERRQSPRAGIHAHEPRHPHRVPDRNLPASAHRERQTTALPANPRTTGEVRNELDR